jgi:hypothetical protein
MENVENRSERLLWKQRIGEFKAIYQSMVALYRERDWNRLDRAYRSIRIVNPNSNSNSNLNNANFQSRLKRAKNQYVKSQRRVQFSQGGNRTRRQKK